MDIDDLGFLPSAIYEPLKQIGTELLYELRLRENAPVTVNYGFKRLYLGEKLTLFENEAIICDKDMIEETLFRAAEYSIYAANESLKAGFITAAGGVRIGVCGECVFDGTNVITIKNFTSLCIRIPHFIEGASAEIQKKAFADGVKNTLIVSAPSYGKTTILKDLALSLSQRYNVLVIDERGELGDRRLKNADIVRYSDKNYAFSYGIRSLAPEIVIADELSGIADWECVRKAVNSGVKIIATAHGGDLESITQKGEFIAGLFDRYVVLRSEGQAGRIRAVYGKNYELC